MTNRTAATRYARALLDVALTERTDLAAIDTQLATFVDVFHTYDTLRKALLNPAVPVPRKHAAVADIVEKLGVLPVVSKILLLLADNDRLAIVPDLAEVFHQRLQDRQGIVRADVTTASALSAAGMATQRCAVKRSTISKLNIPS